jgi:hypothetical protein
MLAVCGGMTSPLLLVVAVVGSLQAPVPQSPAAAPARDFRFVDATDLRLPPRLSTARNSMAVQLADLDGDGDLDVVVPQEFLPNKILRNDGNRFVDASNLLPPLDPTALAGGPQGHDSEDVAIADFNGDGTLDLIFVSEDDGKLGRKNVHEYYRGNKEGGYERILGILPDTEANTVAHADLNGDGAIDLFIGGAGQDRLLINDGTGGFRDETNERLPREAATAQDAEFIDVDGDRDLDLVLGLEGGQAIWINRGGGRFVDESSARLPATEGLIETRRVVAHDIDGDGDLDLYFANVGWMGRAPQDRLLRNDGAGKFADITAEWLPEEGDTTLDALFVDLEGDGSVELLRANMGSFTVWSREGDRFVPANDRYLTFPIQAQNLAFAVADLDGDGLKDIYLACLAGPQKDPRSYDRMLRGTASKSAANSAS